MIALLRGLLDAHCEDRFTLEVKRSSDSGSACNVDQIRSNNGPMWQHNYDANISTNVGSIWSPYNDITASGPMPLTPTPSYMLPLPSTNAAVSKITNQITGLTGSSPPEAAVEATPETTPMKDLKEFKQHLANPHAVRAIFSSQPSSPLRKENQNQFNFPDFAADGGSAATTTTVIQQEVNTRVVTRVSTTYDRRIQQIVHDRSRSHSPFQTIESMLAKQQRPFRSPNEINCKYLNKILHC